MVKQAFLDVVAWCKDHPYIAGGIGIFVAGVVAGLLL